MRATYFEDRQRPAESFYQESKIRFGSDVAIVHEARAQSDEKVLELTRKNESINTNDPI